MQSARYSLIALGLFVLVAPLPAQESALPVDVHGFGRWTYGRTTRNDYLTGTPAGDYRFVSMAINLSKTLDDKLSIHTQAEFSESHDRTEVHLDFAFANYKLSDQLSLRIGQVKHPFGIYTEVIDVGTLRPFIDLPQAFYGPVGFAGRSYKGLGASGTQEIGAWSLAYDVYAGGKELERFAVPEQYLKRGTTSGASGDLDVQSMRNVLGGRLVLGAPVLGLSVGSSSYTGMLNESASSRRTVVAGQAAYRSNRLTLESEIANTTESEDDRTTGGYVLAAYRLTPEWQVAAQYDDLRDVVYGPTVANATSLGRHEESAVAVSRWFSRALVIKAEYHRVNGNRLALPHRDELAAIIAARELRVVTHLFQFGAQFTF